MKSTDRHTVHLCHCLAQSACFVRKDADSNDGQIVWWRPGASPKASCFKGTDSSLERSTFSNGCDVVHLRTVATQTNRSIHVQYLVLGYISSRDEARSLIIRNAAALTGLFA